MDSDSDFENSSTNTSSLRLKTALRRARLFMKKRPTSIADELGNRLSPSVPRHRTNKKRKLVPWKVVPCCLEGPGSSRVPTRGALDRLCKVGLGVLWFDKDCALQLPTCLTPDELHFLIVCLYPLLKEIPYEFCKATGPGNTVVISLKIEDYRMKPSASSPFIPYFTPDRVTLAGKGSYTSGLSVQLIYPSYSPTYFIVGLYSKD